ncbi:hypothetical protein OsI_26034 [Oryza sativa Indica Group]|uniref:Uncharacterized protein n=1 Tax=Oryza sativa subsp. indica TaxID=39946 RepID=A2YLD9_ORYSI|nr:hypothetical protein OsI_26034 [Oryza sativa Indica Group]
MSSLSDIGKENVIPAKVEDLSEEQKAEMEQKMQDLKKAYINSFSMTWQGKVIQKYKCQMPKLEGEGSSGAKAVHHALINQSGILVTTLSNLINSVVDGSIAE